MELSSEDIRAIRETHDEVVRMASVIGDSTSGLCAEVRRHGERITRLEVILAFAAGGGGLTGGIIGITKLLGG